MIGCEAFVLAGRAASFGYEKNATNQHLQESSAPLSFIFLKVGTN